MHNNIVFTDFLLSLFMEPVKFNALQRATLAFIQFLRNVFNFISNGIDFFCRSFYLCLVVSSTTFNLFWMSTTVFLMSWSAVLQDRQAQPCWPSSFFICSMALKVVSDMPVHALCMYKLQTEHEIAPCLLWGFKQPPQFLSDAILRRVGCLVLRWIHSISSDWHLHLHCLVESLNN